MKGPFSERSLAVVNDFTIDEQLYLYKKTAELKKAIQEGGDLSPFKLNNTDINCYLMFLEDSTRTKESFKNAASFHNLRLNIFDASSSSFNKKESLTDTIKMLCGYSHQSIFIIRSPQEGVCRMLSRTVGDYAEKNGFLRPSFINGGDGKHEHPSQEFLDEYSFLEQKKWDRSKIHIVLTGDLFHGRTVHSKVNGLRIFKEVKVDLVAPEELSLPPFYLDQMEKNGFKIRIFSSIEEYLKESDIADIWYFTRLQLERMGDEILEKADSLRNSVTFKQSYIDKLAPGSRFYHPLPRHREYPVIPSFLDETALNGWDEQSINGYYTRIIEIGMLGGLLGEDYQGDSKKEEKCVDDFIEKLEIKNGIIKDNYKVGIKPVENGIVIDHIAKGKDIEEIWHQIDRIRRIMKLNYRSSHGVYHTNDRDYFKGIISLPDILSLSEAEIKKLAAISPGSTLNMIEDGRVKRKLSLKMPPRLYNFEEISCKNENCITHPSKCEPVKPEFYRDEHGQFVCVYCDKPHLYQDIWDLKY